MGRKIKDTRMFNTEPVIEQAVDEYFDDKPGTDVIPAEKPKKGRPKKDPAINGIDPAAAKALDKATKKREEIVVNIPGPDSATTRFPHVKVPITKSRWQIMKRRCYDKKLNVYPMYGGKGIKVCDRWLDSYENFLADMGVCPGDDHFLDRIDGEKDYSPSNCRWVTTKESNSNRKSVRWVTHQGKTLHVDDWIKELKLVRPTVCDRIVEGWDVKQALEFYPLPISINVQKSKKTGRVLPTENIGHSKVGFSSISRTLNCPAWVTASKNISVTTSEHAAEGTLFHSYIEQIKRLDYQPVKQKELLASIEDDEMREHVESWLTFINKIEAQLINDRYPFRRFIEQKVYLTDEIYGTLDYGLVFENATGLEAVIVDAKYGSGVVIDANQNPQLIGYALALNELVGGKIQKFHLLIFQPRVHEKGWVKWVVTAQELQKWSVDIVNKATLALDLESGRLPITQEYFSAGSHCRFCPAFGECATAKQANYDGLQTTAADLPIEDAVKKLTLDEQVAIFKKKSHIEDFLKAVASNLHQAFVSGVEHPDLKLIRTNGRRKWNADDETIAAELKVKGIVDPWKKKVMGLTEAERELGKDKGKIAHLLEMGEGKIELVEASDKRPPLQIAQAQELPA